MMSAITRIKEEIERAKRIEAQVQALIAGLEVLVETDTDDDYEKNTEIDEQTATSDIAIQNAERAAAYRAEQETITIDALKSKAADAAHRGHSAEIKKHLNEIGVKKISDIPEDKRYDFLTFLNGLSEEAVDA